MRQYRIRGGNRIAGELCVGGSKNAVLPILAALCLNESETVIHNCPRIADTFVSIEILEYIGCEVEFKGNTLKVRPYNGTISEIPDECVKKMRSSILFMSALLARSGKVKLTLPGGCAIGDRAIDLHISGLRAMGAVVREEENMLLCETQGLKGAVIHLRTPSVGATENLMIAAATAKGETILKNAAKEPEIIDLAKFLTGLGAEIYGAGTGTIVIQGVKKLGHIGESAGHAIMPDRIVAGTYLTAAAMTGGEVLLSKACPQDLTAVTDSLTEMGCRVLTTTNTIALRAPKRLSAIPELVTKEYPGFPTDMQAQFVAALTLADGSSKVKENIFESRYRHAIDLNLMGADITMSADNQTFEIKGCEKLTGTTVAAFDLRGGAALVLAGLAAEGETIVKDAQYVERGYEHIEKDLVQLGGDIKLETVAAAESKDLECA